MSDFAPIRVRLDPSLDDRSVVARLNDADGLVAAHLDGDAIVIRPRRQPMVAGMPVYYSGRPEFRGRLTRDDDGRPILSGSVQRSDLLVVFIVVSGLFAAFGALTGFTLIASGDMSGVAVVLFAAVFGTALFATAVMQGRLSGKDEQTILTAIGRLTEGRPDLPNATAAAPG